MKIGIITVHNSPNYGASLQSYALWAYIERQGHSCEVIDLHRPYQDDYIPSRRYRPYGVERTYKSIVKSFVRRFVRRPKGNALYSEEAFKKFKAFNSVIRLSRPYYGIDDLYADPPLYDLYISGSDQLWNPTQPYCLEPYFLTFAPKGKKRISYATSIGVIRLAPDVEKDFKTWLASYDAISVRERQGKERLERFVDQGIVQVADPTFLIPQDEWEAKSVQPQERSYILLFMLQHNPAFLEYALKISREAGKRLVYLCQLAKGGDDLGYKVVNDASIEVFLGYIRHADLVLTESFHGTVFSLLLGTKNFFTFIAAGNGRGSRIEDLLSQFGLQSHILYPDSALTYREMQADGVNREKVSGVISKMRNQSVAFLRQYL